MGLKKDLKLFDVTSTQQIECDTIENNLNDLKLVNRLFKS